ncbi:hypothetical protein EV421DRAFT_1863083 [Armillaria borealis]|uniref:Uncharacterized protein n=1 Tax=Armillaria borealis TaxID=47425 RepID=A0AA39ISZ8_9AGAR|nr:hypothetical protein EV421DRAFT_1863083 [Armillaria borealis]
MGLTDQSTEFSGDVDRPTLEPTRMTSPFALSPPAQTMQALSSELDGDAPVSSHDTAGKPIQCLLAFTVHDGGLDINYHLVAGGTTGRIDARLCIPLHGTERTEFVKFQQVEDVATTIATSTSSGTAANTVALVVVLWYLLPKMFPPLRPSEAINLLEDAIKEVADMYNEHKSILGDWATFETRFKRLELVTLELMEKHIQDSVNVSWANLPSRLSHEKYAWTTACRYHREFDSLKPWLVLAIIRAKKAPLQTALETGDRREDRATAPGIGVSVVRKDSSSISHMIDLVLRTMMKTVFRNRHRTTKYVEKWYILRCFSHEKEGVANILGVLNGILGMDKASERKHIGCIFCRFSEQIPTCFWLVLWGGSAHPKMYSHGLWLTRNRLLLQSSF